VGCPTAGSAALGAILGELRNRFDTVLIDAPVCADPQSGSTNEDTALNASVVCTDVDSGSLTYSKVGGPSHGTATVNANGTFTYTPALNYNGADSFTFKANDGTANSNTATVTLTIDPVNDAPVAADGSATTNEDTATTILDLAVGEPRFAAEIRAADLEPDDVVGVIDHAREIGVLVIDADRQDVHLAVEPPKACGLSHISDRPG